MALIMLLSIVTDKGVMKMLRELHKWLSLAISLFLMLFVVSGIIMNHRRLFSACSVSRSLLPENYRYQNWNLAAVKGFVHLPSGEKLIYGNIGIWKTDSTFNSFEDMNNGFKKGVDQRKTFTLLLSKSGELYSGTLFGLYIFDTAGNTWTNIPLPEGEARVVKILEQEGAILILTRSFLYELHGKNLTRLSIPAPQGYDGKVRLFRTLWVIHSGEVFGPVGRLIVDLAGTALLFLIVSGLYFTFLSYATRKLPGEKCRRLFSIDRTSIKWHSWTGFYGFIVFMVLVLTGSFLRPPLLIPIANSYVAPIPHTRLAGQNAWEDKLRDIVYDKPSSSFIISTSDGFFHFRPGDTHAEPFRIQPPVSIMGITVFEPLPDSSYLVGSFNGLFRWNPHKGSVAYALTGQSPAQESGGSLFGEIAVAGVMVSNGRLNAVIDYNAGWIPLEKGASSPEMPAVIRFQPFSLWNLSQEVHTGRIFSPIAGGLYILYVPLMGIGTMLSLITGLLIWLKMRRKKRGLKDSQAAG